MKILDIGNCESCVFYTIDHATYTAARMTNNIFNFYCNKRKQLIKYTPNASPQCMIKISPPNQKESP